MTNPTIAFREYLIKIGLNKDADFLQEGFQLLSQMLMELEVEEDTGARKYERTTERKNQRLCSVLS
jgi:transposase-like protein